MPKWLKDFWARIKTGWTGLSLLRKLLLVGIVVVLVAAFVLLGVLSSSPTRIAVFNTAITDTELADRIGTALDAENIAYERAADNKFYAKDELTARRARALLMREDLLPGQLDPWNFFTNMDRWTITDFDRNVNLQQSLKINLEQHIAALSDVDSAKVTLVIPQTALFAENQNPVTASVIITPKPGSDIAQNTDKVQGIVKLVQFAVEGLLPDNITISDINGNVLNDFSDLEAGDRLKQTASMLKQKRALETQYTSIIMKSLSNVFTASRVNIVNFDIDLNFVRKSIETEEFFPVTMKLDDPKTPYSELEVVPSIIRSRENSTEDFEGTGFNPEGPPGQEGQTPPAYQDLTNLVGQYNSDKNIENYEINKRNISEEKSPYEINRISLGLMLDGTWKLKFDDAGEPVLLPSGDRDRIYEPVAPDILKQARTVVESAIGFNPARGDVVTVENIPFDRLEQFKAEDEIWRRSVQTQKLVFWGLIGFFSLIVLLGLIHVIRKQIERRRLAREEELIRQHRAMREAALRSAEEEGIEVEMSVEERRRMEMQDSAKKFAREYPEDVANLLKTWLMEN